MNLFEISKLDKEKPRMNPVICESFVYHQLRDPIAIVRGYLTQIQDSFGEHLKLLDVRMCTPTEEIAASYITNNYGASSKRLKLDENNLFMIAVEFSYFDHRLPPYYIRLPYILRGGKLVMDGRTFFVLPVLADRGVNIKGNEMYLPISRQSTPVKTSPYYFKQNGMTSVDNILIAEFHGGALKSKGRGKVTEKVTIKPTLFMYLLLKSGLTKAVKDYLDLDVEVITGDMNTLLTEYDTHEYTLYSSNGGRPRGLSVERWRAPNLHLVFKGKPTHQQSEVAANFFYIYDYFVNDLDLDDMESTDIWKTIAGRIIFSNDDESFAMKAARVDDHLVRCIDLLIDRETRRELLIDDIDVTDSYELFAWFIKNEKESFTKATSNSFHNKRLVSARYTLAPISTSINRLSYELDNFKKNDTPPTLDKMKRTLRKYIREGLLRDIRGKNNEVVSIQAPTDNIWLNITRTVVPQIKAKSGRGSSGMLMDKPENLAHETVLTCAKVDNIPKSEPTRKSSINPYMHTDADGILAYDQYYQPLQDHLAKMIRYDYGFKDDADIIDYDFDGKE